MPVLYKLVIFLLLGCVCFCTHLPTSTISINQVQNYIPATKGALPFHGALFTIKKPNKFLCSVILLSPKLAITSKQCVKGQTVVLCKFGEILINPQSKADGSHDLTSILITEDNFSSISPDYITIKLQDPIQSNNHIRPILLGTLELFGNLTSVKVATSFWKPKQHSMQLVHGYAQINSICSDVPLVECPTCSGSGIYGDSGAPLIAFDKNGVPRLIGTYSRSRYGGTSTTAHIFTSLERYLKILQREIDG